MVLTNNKFQLAKINLLNIMIRAKDIGTRDFFLFQLLDASSAKRKSDGEIYSSLIMKDLVTTTKRTEGTLRLQLKRLENAGLIKPIYVIEDKTVNLISETNSWQKVLGNGLRNLKHTLYRIEINKLIKVDK